MAKLQNYYKMMFLINSILLYGEWVDLMKDLQGEFEFFIEFIIDRQIHIDENSIVTAWKQYREEFRVTPRFPSAKLKAQVYEKHGYRCTKCSSQINLRIDHVIPYTKFGKTVFDNLTVLCEKCNQEKTNSCF